MKAIDLINIIQPKHNRTSCSDDDLENGFYSNDGYTRCLRCTLLEVLKKGFLPESHSLCADFTIDNKIAKEEQAEVKK